LRRISPQILDVEIHEHQLLDISFKLENTQYAKCTTSLEHIRVVETLKSLFLKPIECMRPGTH